MTGIINQGMQPGAAQQTPQGAPEDEAPESDGSSDPGYQQALKFAMDALYKNDASQSIAQQLRGSKNVAEAMAEVAYNIVSISDERTQGAVPDELLVLFASSVLQEVADIATAARVPVKPADIAVAMRTMILRYLGENGVDTSQLQSAMDKVNPDDFNKLGSAEAQAGA